MAATETADCLRSEWMEAATHQTEGLPAEQISGAFSVDIRYVVDYADKFGHILI